MSLVNDVLLAISKFCGDYEQYVIQRHLLKIKPINLKQISYNELHYLPVNHYYVLIDERDCILNVYFLAFKFVKFSINKYTPLSIRDIIPSYFDYDKLKKINIFNVKNLNTFDITENIESVNLTISNPIRIEWIPHHNLTYLKCAILLDDFLNNYTIYLNIKNIELRVVNTNNYLYISKKCNVIDTLIISLITNYTILEYFGKFEIRKLSLRKIVNILHWIPYIDNFKINNLEIEIELDDIAHIYQLKNKISSLILNITKKIKPSNNNFFVDWINLNKLTICNPDKELHLDYICSANITKLSLEQATITMQTMEYLHKLQITELSFIKCNFCENNLSKIILPNTVTKFIYKDNTVTPIISIRHNIDYICLILNAKQNVLDILDVGEDNKIKTLNLEINGTWNEELLLKSDYQIGNLIINTEVISINCSQMNTKNIEISYCNLVLPPYLDTLVAKYGCIFNEIEVKHIKLAKLLYIGKQGMYQYKYSNEFLSKIDLIIFV